AARQDARGAVQGNTSAEVRVRGVRERQRARRQGDAGARGRGDDAAADHVVQVDRLNVIAGEEQVEVENREREIRPQRDLRDLRQVGNVRDREEGRLRSRLRRREIHFEVREQQRGRRRDADVAAVVVVRRGRAGSGRRRTTRRNHTERVSRIRTSHILARGECRTRHQQGGHHGQDHQFLHLYLLHVVCNYR